MMIHNPALVRALLEVALRPNRKNRMQPAEARPAARAAKTPSGWIHDTSGTLPGSPDLGHSYVYAVSVTLAGPVKFGRARNARERIKGLETARGARFGFIWLSEPCSNAASIERTLHAQSAALRQVGEWFAMPFGDAVQLADAAPYAFVGEAAYAAQLAALAGHSLRDRR